VRSNLENKLSRRNRLNAVERKGKLRHGAGRLAWVCGWPKENKRKKTDKLFERSFHAISRAALQLIEAGANPEEELESW